MKRTVTILIVSAATMAAPVRAGDTATARNTDTHVAAATAQVRIIRMEQIRFAGQALARDRSASANRGQTLSRRHVAADGRILIEFN